MKAKGAALQGGLAAVALVAAYCTWQRGPEDVPGEVVVLDASKGDVTKVRLQDGPRWLELYPAKDEHGLTVWVKWGEDTPPPTPTGSSDAGEVDAGVPPVPVATPLKPREVRANERAEKLLEKFAPLKGARALGALSGDKLKELGFEGSTKLLEVTTKGQVQKFTVSTGGFGNPYLKAGDGRVYLVSSALLTELEPTSQALVERRLHAFRPSEFDELTVNASGKVKAFVHTGADGPSGAKVAPKESPDKPDDFVRNWHEKVWSRLIVTEVFGKGEALAGGEPTIVVRVDYAERGKPRGWLELATGKAPNELFARSERTASWVSLHASSEDVIGEAKKVVGAP